MELFLTPKTQLAVSHLVGKQNINISQCEPRKSKGDKGDKDDKEDKEDKEIFKKGEVESLEFLRSVWYKDRNVQKGVAAEDILDRVNKNVSLIKREVIGLVTNKAHSFASEYIYQSKEYQQLYHQHAQLRNQLEQLTSQNNENCKLEAHTQNLEIKLENARTQIKDLQRAQLSLHTQLAEATEQLIIKERLFKQLKRTCQTQNSFQNSMGRSQERQTSVLRNKSSVLNINKDCNSISKDCKSISKYDRHQDDAININILPCLHEHSNNQLDNSFDISEIASDQQVRTNLEEYKGLTEIIDQNSRVSFSKEGLRKVNSSKSPFLNHKTIRIVGNDHPKYDEETIQASRFIRKKR